jgi:hypothetical protein
MWVLAFYQMVELGLTDEGQGSALGQPCSIVVDAALGGFWVQVAIDLQRGGIVAVFRVVLLVLREAFEFLLQVAHFAQVALSAGSLDLRLILLDVLVDCFHAGTG